MTNALAQVTPSVENLGNSICSIQKTGDRKEDAKIFLHSTTRNSKLQTS